MTESGLQFKPELPPGKDQVFCQMMLDGWLYERLFFAVTGRHYELIGTPLSQTVVKQPGRRLTPSESQLLNSIRLDTIAPTTEAYIAADMQNEYIPELVINRAIFYGFRVSAFQPIPKPMRYDLLKPTIISFVVNDASQRESETIPVILANGNDGTKISDLLSVYVIFTAGIVGRNDRSNLDLYTFARFFEMRTFEQAYKFEQEFSQTELGGNLMRVYNQATAEPFIFAELGNEPYFTEKLTEEEKLEIMEEGKNKWMNEGMNAVLSELLKRGILSPEQASDLRTAINP